MPDKIAPWSKLFGPPQFGFLGKKALRATILRNTAEGGTNGAAVTIGNSGGASGDAWNDVDNSPTYSNAHSSSGTLGYRFQSASEAIYWQNISAHQVFGRAYIYIATYFGSSGFSLAHFIDNTAVVTRGRVLIWFDGTVNIADEAGTVATTSMTLAANTLYRLEWNFVTDPTAGSLECRVYAGHSTTVLETLSFTNHDTSGDGGPLRVRSLLPVAADVFTDDYGLSTLDWLGPSVTTTSVVPGLIGPTGTLYAPGEVLAVVPGLIGPTNTLYAPTQRLTVKPGVQGPATLFAPTKVATVRVYAPVISQTQAFPPGKEVLTVKPGVQGPTGTLFAPSKVRLTVLAPLIISGQRFAPTKITLTVKPGLISQTQAFAPGKELLTVKPGLIGPTGTLYVPTVSVAAGAKVPPLIGPTGVLYAATIRLTVKPGLIGPTGTLFAPGREVLTVKPGLISNTQRFAPTQRLTVKPGLIGPTNVLYAPTKVRLTVKPPVVSQTQAFPPGREVLTVKPGLISQTQMFAATISAGAKLPPKIGPTGTLFSPTRVATVRVYAPLIGATGTLYTPAGAVGAAKIPPRIGPTGTLFAPTVLLPVVPSGAGGKVVYRVPQRPERPFKRPRWVEVPVLARRSMVFLPAVTRRPSEQQDEEDALILALL